jgi:hypothetical protein
MDRLQHHVNCICQRCISHPSHAKPGIHVFPDHLYVVTMLENPLRWRSRYWNYWMFERECEAAGALLYTVEVAFGDRHFEITEPGNPRHLQLRTRSELWHKENALNLLINRLPAEAAYIAWIDADIKFQRPDWAQETMQLLQHFDFLQMFSYAQDMNPDYEPVNQPSTGFMYKWLTAAPPPHDPRLLEPRVINFGYSYGAGGVYGHPGFAWAARKDALDRVGGLIDFAILGSGDYHMATALVGQVERSLPHHTKSYRNWCYEWQDRAERFIRRNVGYMPGTALHSWHGHKGNRNYNKRFMLLGNAAFDPVSDIKRDWQGLWALNDQWTPRSIALRDGIRAYARMRNEDAV